MEIPRPVDPEATPWPTPPELRRCPCGWRGSLAVVTWRVRRPLGEWDEGRTVPLCLICRTDARDRLRDGRSDVRFDLEAA